jgi:hypothetical protein
VSPGHLLSILKKKIKKKINIKKTTFYTFEVLNARNLRYNFYFNIVNQYPGHSLEFSIFLKLNYTTYSKQISNFLFNDL